MMRCSYSRTSGVAELLLIAVPGGIEHYFSEISQAADAEEQERVGPRYGIRGVLAPPGTGRVWLPDADTVRASDHRPRQARERDGGNLS
jgi:hypothetical protein